MSYAVFGLSAIERDLVRLRKRDYKKIEAAILQLAEDPRPVNCQKLKGRDAWRIRVGDYRVIYQIDDGARAVTIVHVAHRRDVYP